MSTDRSPRMLRVLLLAAATAALVLAAPPAAAHTCTAEKGEPNEADCNKPCTEGEAHSHLVTHHHENGLADDTTHIHYECKSTVTREKEEPKKCLTPRIFTMCPIEEPDALT